MKKLVILVLSGMAAVSAMTVPATAQAPMNLPSPEIHGVQGQTASKPAPLSVYAPSEVAVSPSGAPDHQSRLRQGRRVGAPGPNSAASGLNLPRLCFQPGIGWTTLPAIGTESSAAVNRDGANSDLPIARGASPAAKSPQAVECPPAPLAPGNTPSDHDDSFQDSGSPTLNPLLADDSIAGEGLGMQAKPALGVPAGAMHSDPADPRAVLQQLKTLRARAYISPVKLRQLSRNVQDMETRLELRQMHTEVAKRKKDTRRGEDQYGVGGKTDSAAHKQTGRRDLSAMKNQCEHGSSGSKSKVCLLLKAGGIH